MSVTRITTDISRDLEPHTQTNKDNGMFSTKIGEDVTTITNSLQRLLGRFNDGTGKGLVMEKQFGYGNLAVSESYGHTTTSLPYTIHGTATVIERTIGTYLARFSDPIKAILGTRIEKGRRVVIKREYVVGGSTLITPERAPARTVGLKSDIREFMLTRFGGDIEMNLNTFLVPERAARELQLKLDAQKMQLEQKLIELGYEAVFEHSTNLIQALHRAMPTTAKLPTKEKAEWANNVYVTSVFGCFAKYKFPLSTLLMTCKQAGVYTPIETKDVFNTMIVPSGVMEMLNTTKPDTMAFSVSGLKTTESGKVSLPLSNVYVDPKTSIKILAHIPYPQQGRHGTAYPYAESSPLDQEVSFGTFYVYDNARMRLTNFKSKQWSEVEPPQVYADPGDNEITVCLRPNMRLLMSSAILGIAGGSENGELLFAYPSTGVSTSQTTESLKIQMRVYLGAGIYSPDRIIILPHVHFNRALGGHGMEVGSLAQCMEGTKDLVWALLPRTALQSNGTLIYNDNVFHPGTVESLKGGT